MSRLKYFFYSLLAALLVIILQADIIQPSNIGGKIASKLVSGDSAIINFLTVKVANAVPVGTQAVYYISPQGDDNNPGTVSQPFRTIAQARNTIRPLASNMSGNILVYIRGGEYVLTNPLNFGVEDSGTNGFSITYQAYANEKPVVSGGYTITGWTAFKNGIYQTNVGRLRFRQLYVNGKKRVRARTPNDGSFYRMKSWDKANQQLVLNASEIEPWQNLNNVEMVILRGSNQNRLRISSYATLGADASVVPMDPERNRAFGYNDYTLFDHQPYYFENALEFLDSPGEWYLNSASGDLFYLPQTGEDISASTVVAPTLASLVQINGTTSNTVHNIKFQGLTFQYATWMTPSDEGYAETQAGEYVDNHGSGRPKMPAAITVSLAEQLTFQRNVFKNMGAGAINFDHSTRHNSIIGNVFTEISGNAISIDRRSWYPQPYNEFVTSGDVIKNNYIYKVAQDFFACVGISTGFTDSVVIQHNELAQLPYTGISLGWGWMDNDTSLKNNVAQYNHVHNFMTLNNDGGGIYILSKQPETKIVQNYIHDAVRSQWAHVWPIAGVYLDNGSGSIKVESNVIQNTPEAVFVQVGNLRTNTIQTTVSNSQSVIDNSGIESAYDDIKNYP